MALKDTPIQRKLMSVMLLTSAIALFLMCSAYILLEYFSYRETMLNNVSAIGKIIASNSSGALAFLSEKDAQEILGALNAEKHIQAACLYDINGKIFAKYPAGLPDSELPGSSGIIQGFYYKSDYLVGFVPVKQENKMLGTLYLKSDLTAMFSQLEKFALIGIFLIMASLFIAFFLSRTLQKSISEPILALQETANIITSKNDYSVRAIKHGKDEVGALADAFNQMLAQIQLKNREITSFNQQLELKVRERTTELQKQKDFVETILNATVDIIAVFDKDLRYIMLNKTPESYNKFSAAELIGRDLPSLIPESMESSGVKNIKRALAGEMVHEPTNKSTDTERTFESFYIPLRDSEGLIYGALNINHDVTEITEAAEHLEALNAKLMKSNRDLEQFAYVASHDLQEPLRKIQTFTQLMDKHVDDPEKLNYYLSKINQSAFRMQQLIQDVLNFSRISNTAEAFIETDLNELLENLKIDFELIFREKNGELQYETLPKIKGIPLQLSQLFSNLISNSLKYSEKSPVITITHSKMSRSEIKSYSKLDVASPYTKIIYTDNGIGFESQFNEQIFDIFQRLHGKQSYSGTGIGLALCRKITDNHNGFIFAKGIPGAGATFTIMLPLNS